MEAEKSRDYILLADLIELQVVRFLCNIQTLIVEREDFCAFDEEIYQKNLDAMKRKISRSTALFVRDAQERELRIGQVLRLLEADLYPEQLLEQGYCVEFTSCGEMTVGVPKHFRYRLHGYMLKILHPREYRIRHLPDTLCALRHKYQRFLIITFPEIDNSTGKFCQKPLILIKDIHDMIRHIPTSLSAL